MKARFPKVRVVVGRWGMKGDTTRANQYLTDAGADKSAWTLKNTLDVLAPKAATPGTPAGATVADVAKTDGPAKPKPKPAATAGKRRGR